MIDEFSMGRGVRLMMVRQTINGFRSHPLAMLALLLVVSLALAAALAAFFVAAALAALVIAAGILTYGVAHQFLKPSRSSGRRRVAARNPTETLHRFLAAVDEFARLYELAMSAGIDSPQRGRQFREAGPQAGYLRDFARGLSDGWRGSASVADSMQELESATAALHAYLAALYRRPKDRPAPALLHWYRDDLSRRRDALAESVRDAEFRAAAT